MWRIALGLVLPACDASMTTYAPFSDADPPTVPGGAPATAATSTGTTGTPTAPASSASTPDAPEPIDPSVWVELHGDAIAMRTDLPLDDGACAAAGDPTAPCGDADGDGLTDAWEDAALEVLRPMIELDEEEPFVGEPDAVLAQVGRVVPADDGRIRMFLMLGWSIDYGRCGLSGHAGDSERVVLDLEPLPDGAGDVAFVRAYTAAHENTINDHGHVFPESGMAELEFDADPVTGDPRWLVYASDGKHATYGTKSRCEGSSALPCVEEDCGADGADPAQYVLSPDVHNAGEPDAPRLADLGPIGFPDEDAWLDQDFCGGLGRQSGCAGPVVEKLTVDPF